MKPLKYFLIISYLIGYAQFILSYDVPSAINLGITNILDGGPKIENPGFYVEPFLINYYSNTFTDQNGNQLQGKKSPTLNSFITFTEFLYQSKFKIFGGAPGCSVIPFPLQFSSLPTKTQPS